MLDDLHRSDYEIFDLIMESQVFGSQENKTQARET